MVKPKSKKSKIDTGEIEELVDEQYNNILLMIGKVGLATIGSATTPHNYVVFEVVKRTAGDVQITQGYYGNTSLNFALRAMSALILKRKLVRKSAKEPLELEEMRKVIDAHVRGFDKLLSGLDL